MMKQKVGMVEVDTNFESNPIRIERKALLGTRYFERFMVIYHMTYTRLPIRFLCNRVMTFNGVWCNVALISN